MRVSLGVTVAIEIAHLGVDGVMHGHSLTAEVWTDLVCCLEAWRARVVEVTSRINGQLEHTIGGRTFEDVAAAVLVALPDATKVVVRLPTRGHIVECQRDVRMGRRAVA